jgi:hypothetical protein
MKNALVGLVGLVVLLGVAGRAKADTIDFTFVSTPNSGGTYVDASGTLTGNITYLNNPADQDILFVNSGMITVVSNVPPTPYAPGVHPLTPELNGNSTTNASGGGFLFANSPGGIVVSDVGNSPCDVCFVMPGDPADGGDFTFSIEAIGINGASDNAEIIASDGGNHGYLYETTGTLTLSGQVADYQLTPEPPSWLLLGSGVMLLGFGAYCRTAAV